MLRENKRMLDKAIRELDRERMGLQQQEKKTIAEIKKMAKEGQMVRLRCCGASLQSGCAARIALATFAHLLPRPSSVSAHQRAAGCLLHVSASPGVTGGVGSRTLSR